MSQGFLTVIEASEPVGKTYSKDASGKIVKTTAAQITNATATVRKFGSVQGLADTLAGLTPNQAITSSCPRESDGPVQVVTERAKGSNPGAISRTKKDMGWRKAPGFVLLDVDMPASGPGYTPSGIWSTLCERFPELRHCGALCYASGSSHIWDTDTAVEVHGLRGFHLIVLVEDATDTERMTKALAEHFWLMGMGSIHLTAAGSFSVRSPIDTQVANQGRLVFSASAVCHAPLEQRRGRPVILSDGGWLDSRKVPSLTTAERGRYEAMVEEAKAARRDEAMALRAQHRKDTVSKRVPDLMKQGVSAAVAEERIGAMVDAAYGGTLLADFVFTVVHDDGRREQVTCEQVLAHRDRWHGSKVLVPLNEGHRGGSPDAILFLQSASPICYSLDDGGVLMRLRRERVRFEHARGGLSQLVEVLVPFVLSQDDVYLTDAGPVQLVDGKVRQLNVARLRNLVGSRSVIVSRGGKGSDAPMDMTKEMAEQTLAALP